MFTAPVGVALLAGREVSAFVGVVVAAVVENEEPSNVVTRWAAQRRRPAAVTLTAVIVT